MKLLFPFAAGILFLQLQVAECHAQRSDTVQRYLDNHFLLTTKKEKVYAAKSYRSGAGFILDAFYPAGTIIFRKHYTDRALQQANGPVTFYYADGKTKSKGVYQNNLPTGIWAAWHSNGTPLDSGRYEAGKKEGYWRTWYPNGTLEAEGRYKGGRMTGEWRWYRSDGSPSTREMYDLEGKVSGLVCYDSTGKELTNLCSVGRPALLQHNGVLYDYIVQHFQWPYAALQQKNNGAVLVTVSISEAGKMVRMTIDGTNLLLANAVKDFMAQLPAWEPAISHNRYVSWEEQIEILYDGQPKISRRPTEQAEIWRPDWIQERMWED